MLSRARFFSSCSFALALASLAPAQTESAVANGDTRTITLYHSHTHESITATFRVNGAYDQATLEKLNWFLRDWRRDEPTRMDPRLFDAVWETYRETGSREPIVIVSAYRSPETNSMLRHRTRGVAEFSQHMLGKAMDMHYTDVPMSRVREIAMRLQRGGVGYYPTSGTPFVHMDVGNVRAWPRMTYDQLARLFPDGKTVHLASDGRMLAHYADAREEIQARNGVSVPTVAQVQQQNKGFFAWLFGGGDTEDGASAGGGEANPGPRVGGDSRVAAFIAKSRGANAAPRVASAAAAPQPGAGAPAAVASAQDNSVGGFFVADANRSVPAAVATTARAASANATAVATSGRTPAPAQLEAVVASAAPTPPRRPAELAMNLANAANAPLPIPRPPALPADAGLRALRAAALPSVITTGGAAPAKPSATGALAYAPTPPVLSEVPRPVRAPAPKMSVASLGAQAVGLRAAAARGAGAASTRIDRANFRLLTGSLDVAHAAPTSFAPVVTGLRQAARHDAVALAFAQPAGLDARFGAGSPAPATEAFSGAAVQPLRGAARVDLTDAAPAATGFN